MYLVHKEVFLMKKVIRAELRTEDWVNTGFILIEDIVESEKAITLIALVVTIVVLLI